MERKLVLISVIVILLTSLLGVAFRVERVQASGTIYIRADGSIDPPTANITSVDNVTYTFTDNNYDSIVVERDNIVIDGVGYTLQGTGSGDGANLSGRSNVTVRNIEIKAFYIGVYLYSSFNNTVSGNYINSNNDNGVYLYEASNNTISGNNITNNEYGIHLHFSSNNTVSENHITSNNVYGVHLFASSNNTISGNNITANSYSGVILDLSYNNAVSGNIFVDDGLFVLSIGLGNVVLDNLVNGKPLVYLQDTSDLVVEDAGQVILVNCTRIRVENLTLSNTTGGVQLCKTNNTTITRNSITNNSFSVFLFGSSSNTVSENCMTNNDNGVCLLHSSSNTVLRNNITSNNRYSVHLDESSYNTVSGNNMTNNEVGMYLYEASNNTVSENNITSNSEWGIRLNWASNNTIYHNNFVNNTQQTYSFHSTNVWDDGCEGNFWSDFTGSDSNRDGIGDTSYVIDGSNQDNYPLMNPYWNPADVNHDLKVDIFDAVTVCVAYSSTPSDFNWNCHGDIAEPIGVIDLYDIEMIQLSYGEEY